MPTLVRSVYPADDDSMGGARPIRLRYPATCAGCGAKLIRGALASWSSDTKQARCERCADADAADDESTRTEMEIDAGEAGASARREFERRRKRREERVRTAYPRLGRLILALSKEPQSSVAWARGAEGERLLGARLDDCAGDSVIVLHDRRIPHSRANIDHLIVTPERVFVVDAKRYTGQVRKRDVGSFLRRDERLYVGRRDCTNLVAASKRQSDFVREALAPVDRELEVVAVVCFVGADWGWFAQPFTVDGVFVTWPKSLAKVISKRGDRPGKEAEAAASLLARRLPSAR